MKTNTLALTKIKIYITSLAVRFLIGGIFPKFSNRGKVHKILIILHFRIDILTKESVTRLTLIFSYKVSIPLIAKGESPISSAMLQNTQKTCT